MRLARHLTMALGVEQIIQDVRYGIRTFLRAPGLRADGGARARARALAPTRRCSASSTPCCSSRCPSLNRPSSFTPTTRTRPCRWRRCRGRSSSPCARATARSARSRRSRQGPPPSPAAASRSRSSPIACPATSSRSSACRRATGRLINAGDDVPNGGKVIALGYALWQRLYGGDPRAVGQSLTVDGEPYTVVSVMPASFGYPAGADAWVPLALPAKFQGNNFLRLIGRLKPGNSLSQAADDLHAISTAYNQANGLKRDVKVYSLHEYLVGRNRRMLLVMQGAVAFVLLIACANVANLLLARSVSRVRELAIRAALGAGRFRLVRQLLTESLLLSAAGSVLGVLLASWLLRLFLALAPTNFAGVQTIAIDMRVLAFTLIVAFVTGVLFGLAPARRGSGHRRERRPSRYGHARRDERRRRRAPAGFWSSRKSAWRWCW